MITDGPSADAVGRREAVVPNAGDEADRALLVRFDQGDSSAFWSLWQKHVGSLFAACLREMRGNRADAEDALGQAMLKAHETLSVSGRDVVCPAAWLRRMASNLCRDILRRRIRLAAVMRLQQGAGTFPAVDARVSVHRMRAMIDALPARLRDAVLLRFIDELSYDEIGTRLGISAASARKRVQRARVALIDGNGNKPVRRRIRDRPTPARTAFPRTILAQLPSGLSAVVTILVDQKPRRVAQKIATFHAYLARHPRGWKIHLKLADLLYSTGAWADAVHAYGEVLKKRPGLALASQRIAAITALAQAVAGNLASELENVTSCSARSSST